MIVLLYAAAHNSLSQSSECGRIDRLRQNVRLLLRRVAPLQFHLTGLHDRLNEMMFNIDVLRLDVMIAFADTLSDGRLIITRDMGHTRAGR